VRFQGRRGCRRAIKRAAAEAWVHAAGFRGILWVEAPGDPYALAARVASSGSVGRVVAVLAEVPSAVEPVREAAVRLASDHVGAEERFCFRIHKRGKLGFQEPASTLEREIGGAIWKALEQRHRTQPRVDL